MPLGKNVRPSTAVGRLETYNTASIFHNAGPASGKSPTSRVSCVQARARTSIPESRAVEGNSRCLSQAGQTERPEWSEMETETEPLKHHPRRHSVGLGQSVATNENIQRFGNTIKSLRKGKIEQQVSLTHLKSIQAAFEESRNDGRTPLDVEGFKMIMKKCLGYHAIHDDQIEELFRKIDYSADGHIEWDEFCTYMQLKYKRIEESCVRSKRVSFSLPATFRELSHAEQILRIYFTPDQSFIMMREDGTISFWSAQLKLKRSKRLFEKPFHRKPKWVTDFTTMYQYNKFILSTGDREIQIYELSTFEPYCQIAGLETCPLQLDYCSTGADDCMILYGDDQGCVNILLLTSVAETLRTWKKCPKVDNMPSISIENSALSPNMTYIRWKVHEDWVTQLKYYDSITSVITASSHEATALVIGCTTGTTNLEKQMKEMRECWKEGKTTKCHGPCVPQKRLECDQSVFCVHKGVKTFDLCKKKNLLVTGGMDRMVRMWNPYVPRKATGSLRGHCAPICFISISTDDNKLFSVSTDNTIKIWDTEDQCCLYTANQQTSGIKGDISTSLYIPAIKALCIAADSIALLHLKIQPLPQPHHVNSHKEPALCCVYCREFRQVISCSEGSHIGHKENPTTPPLPEKIEEIQRHVSKYSLELLQVYGGEHIDWLHHSLVIKVWDLDTGNLAFEFSGAHDGAAICCMTFDDSGRRLITGGRDGCVKIWNHNNGHCLKILKKEGRSDEICDCTYVEMHKNNYILAVGWDRRINIYCDSSDHLHHVLPPQPHWPDDLKWGHKDDILCIAQCPPTLLATSSYDGETIVWNMISGHICCHLQNPSNRVCGVGRVIDKSVSKVIFLKSRALKIELGASLVTTGPQGSVVFWSLLNGGQLYAAFPASRVKSQLTSLGASTNDSLLYTADDVGYICVYGIKDYAVHGPEAEAAKLVNYWRAHVTSVTCMELIEEQNLMVTSSFEGTVRLWNMDGELIGTFGQPQAWDIYNPAKWVHPMVPYEVLIDPLSLPIHPVLEEETAVTQKLDLHQSEDKKQIVDHQPKSPQVTISDEDIKKEIRNMSSQNSLGKRLRQERFKRLNRPLNHGGPSAYHTLKYFEINTPNPCEKPDLSAMGEDPYDAICFTDSTVDLQACVQEIA